MTSFEQTIDSETYRFVLRNSEGFPKIQIKISNSESCHFKSRELIISKMVIQEMIDLLKTGHPFAGVSRFEFSDPDRSFLIFINGDTTLIGQAFNIISNKREEFVMKNVDKKKFVQYLENYFGPIIYQ